MLKDIYELCVLLILICVFPARNGAEVSRSEKTRPACSHQQFGKGTHSPAPCNALRSYVSFALCLVLSQLAPWLTSKCGRLSKNSWTHASGNCSSTSSGTNLEFLCLTRRFGTGLRITQMSLPCFTSGHRWIWQVRMDWRHFFLVFQFSHLDRLSFSL